VASSSFSPAGAHRGRPRVNTVGQWIPTDFVHNKARHRYITSGIGIILTCARVIGADRQGL
jgi:hypothetical protein